MKSTPFDPAFDLAPTPFEERHCLRAMHLKEAGLRWKPHAGCFVWDREGVIQVPSPFPRQIYFILNLGRFLELFETIENLMAKLVWLPTWHQARLLAGLMGIDVKEIYGIRSSGSIETPEDELHLLYEILLAKLHSGQ
ncbi:MAG: hypothetical protein WAU47_01225 [Desulfobaccales bacterium]